MTAIGEMIKAVRGHADWLDKCAVADADDHGAAATKAVAANWRKLAEDAERSTMPAASMNPMADDIGPEEYRGQEQPEGDEGGGFFDQGLEHLAVLLWEDVGELFVWLPPYPERVKET